jgi:hypothetical protein
MIEVLLLALGTVAPPAPPAPQAGRAAVQAEAPGTMEPHCYGGRILLADAAAMVLMFIGANNGSPEVVYTGMISWVVTPSILHTGHGNAGRGAASLAVRVALPYIAADRFTQSCGQDQTCDWVHRAVGYLFGGAAAMSIDQLLARDEHEWTDVAGLTLRGLAFQPGPHGGALQLHGRF